MKLQLTHCAMLGDWWVLEGGPIGASIEGTAAEWREIADGLDAGKSVSHRRCCASFGFKDGQVCFWSPRNSVDDFTAVPKDKAAELAKHIRMVLDNVIDGVEI